MESDFGADRVWRVMFKADGKDHYFGRYHDKNEAIRVADEARKQLFGEFARER